MKISKLFHWLYAILMLLPLMVFIPNAFYYGFNKEAVAQEKTEQIPVYYESNEVNYSSDIIVNNIYYWEDNYTSEGAISQTTLMYFKYISLFDVLDNENCYMYLTASGDVNIYYSNGQRIININSTNFYFVPKNIVNSNVITNRNIYEHITYTDYKLVKEYQPLVTDMSITDSMSYAWNSVWQNDLFSWSYGSFLTQPFIYIGNLFNVPVDNTLYYALSYWLDISIIWLTFDLLMYVPLLVHRWLDKGIIE